MGETQEPLASRPLRELVARHIRIGWIALSVFVSCGLALELLHAFKLGFYLDPGNETRRLMWTLAHAHGVGLGLLNLGLAATLHALFEHGARVLDWVSMLMSWATISLPLGFFLGGVATYEGDPGIGVILAPIGASMLWLAVALMTREVFTRTRSSTTPKR